ncbi:hypothetical protein DM02DRAFT_620901 [Periconia macrospinosa]|uniref:HTH psq-type domain-containing protein n=1 Tax=Periconia macrospinosa TaxID=97972 RepID=A0A2V1CYD4_9PLEO|nr:hypothetical protein DM02DRAFT_620901 [Periconia macrospinosa]
MPDSYRALEDYSGVPHATLRRRAKGGRSIEEKANDQQYLADWEEDAIERCNNRFHLSIY